MGQKVNALIFRTKNFPYYVNVWNNFNYISEKLTYLLNIKKFVEITNQLNIIHIQSNYYFDNYCIYNVILFSKITYFKNKEYINRLISKFFSKNSVKKTKFGVNVVLFKHPLISTHFLLKYLYIKLIHTKSSLRKIIPQLAVLINKKYKLRGFKCIVSGRINGVQMAKAETFQFNKSSLQTKTSYIKYNFLSIPTKYGLLGVKI